MNIKELESKLEMPRYDIKFIHKEYDAYKYRFLTAKEFWNGMQNEKYRYNHILNSWTFEEFEFWYNEMLKINPPTIEVGTKATIFYYTDRRAATVIKVNYAKKIKKDAVGNPIPKSVEVMFNETECIDYYAGDYKILDQMYGQPKTFSFRRNHRWIEEGSGQDGLVLGIGYHDHYIDPNF